MERTSRHQNKKKKRIEFSARIWFNMDMKMVEGLDLFLGVQLAEENQESNPSLCLELEHRVRPLQRLFPHSLLLSPMFQSMEYWIFLQGIIKAQMKEIERDWYLPAHQF